LSFSSILINNFNIVKDKNMKIFDLVEAYDDVDFDESFNDMAAKAKDIQQGVANRQKQQDWSAKSNARIASGGAKQAPDWSKANQNLTAKKTTPGIGNNQNSNNAANTNVPAPQTKIDPANNADPTAPQGQNPTAPQGQDKGPGIMSKIGQGAKALGGVLSKAADAAPGVINKVGNIGSAATDAAGRTLGGFGAGYNYARHGQGQVHQPGQRTDAPHMQQQAQQSQQAPAQQGGGVGGAIAGAARNFAQNATGGSGADFNAVMKAIPKLTPKQKAAVAKAVGAPAAKPAGAPPAPKVVQGGKPQAPQQAVPEGFHSKFLGMII
jgi:hypothetical protein